MIKVVICGKNKNLDKTTNIYVFLKVNRLLIFVVLYSLQCKIEVQAVLKKMCFNMERSKGNFVCRNLFRNSNVNENMLKSEGSLMHYKECPRNYLFQVSNCKVG